MTTVREIEERIETWAPPALALPGDPIGHQVGDREAAVEAVAVALDPSPANVERAHALGCSLLVTHHPLLFHPLSRVDPAEPVGRAVTLLCRHEMACFAAHTNWDMADGGVNDALAERLGLAEVKRFGEDVAEERVKLVTFVPAEVLDAVMDALAGAGAGEIGLYRRCAFYHPGRGTYEPQPGAEPFTGEVGKRETTDEIRLEMEAPASAGTALCQALEAVHPYEEPAYDLYPQVARRKLGMGRVGSLPAPATLGTFASRVGERLRVAARFWGDASRQVSRVAVLGGAGSDTVRAALAAGADVLVTGETRHHHTWEAEALGIGLIDATHYATEQPGVEALARRLSEHHGETLRVETLP